MLENKSKCSQEKSKRKRDREGTFCSKLLKVSGKINDDVIYSPSSSARERERKETGIKNS